MLVELQERAKLSSSSKDTERRIAKPSDEPEGMVIHVDWQPQRGALGVLMNPADAVLPPGELTVVSYYFLSQFATFTSHSSRAPHRTRTTLTLRRFCGR